VFGKLLLLGWAEQTASHSPAHLLGYYELYGRELRKIACFSSSKHKLLSLGDGNN